MEAGLAASGSTDAEGRFVMKTTGKGEGVKPGKYNVSITQDIDVRSDCKNKKCVLEVTKDGNDFKIELNELPD